MFRNTLTANDKYPFRDLQNLLTPAQLQLSLKPIHLWNLHQILNILKKKDDPYSYFIREITGFERLG